MVSRHLTRRVVLFGPGAVYLAILHLLLFANCQSGHSNMHETSIERVPTVAAPSRSDAKDNNMHETSIERALARAIEDKVGPDEVESVVGQRALLNTNEQGARFALTTADIQPDPTYQATLPDLSRARHVVYWKFEDTDTHVKVIGLYWLDDAPPVLFRGLIGPP